MRQKILVFALLLILVTGAIDLNAQTLVIKAKDGTETTKQVSLLQNFTFSNSNLMLKPFAGSTESYGVSTISKIYFKDLPVVTVPVTTGIEDVVAGDANAAMSIYPNPANDLIYLKNAPDQVSPISIYRIDGTLVLSAQLPFGSSVDVSALNKGLYFLRVNNKGFKFIKL